MSEQPERPRLVWIAEGTAEWEAWREYRSSRGLRVPAPLVVTGESGAGWWFPRTLPISTPLSSTLPISASPPTTNSKKTGKPAKRRP